MKLNTFQPSHPYVFIKSGHKSGSILRCYPSFHIFGHSFHQLNVRASCEVTNVGHLDFVLDPQDCSVLGPLLLKLSFSYYSLNMGMFWTPCVSILYTGPHWWRCLAGCVGHILCHGCSLLLWPYCPFPDTPVGHHSLSVEVTMEIYII